jgi:glycosyltransferase involved in cell wall biosynthesis
LSEARLAGTPVIVSDGGSMPGILGPDAHIFKRGDVDALAQQLEAFFDRPWSFSAQPESVDSIKTMAQDANEIEAHYCRLIQGTLAPAREEAPGCS